MSYNISVEVVDRDFDNDIFDSYFIDHELFQTNAYSGSHKRHALPSNFVFSDADNAFTDIFDEFYMEDKKSQEKTARFLRDYLELVDFIEGDPFRLYFTFHCDGTPIDDEEWETRDMAYEDLYDNADLYFNDLYSDGLLPIEDILLFLEENGYYVYGLEYDDSYGYEKVYPIDLSNLEFSMSFVLFYTTPKTITHYFNKDFNKVSGDEIFKAFEDNQKSINGYLSDTAYQCTIETLEGDLVENFYFEAPYDIQSIEDYVKDCLPGHLKHLADTLQV